MGKDDFKFFGAVGATLILAAFLIYSTYTRDLQLSAGPTVDLTKIEKLVQEGRLTLHEASHWEAVEETP